MDVIAALQNSIVIAGKLRALSKKVEDADFKMLVADLSNELADAKLDAASLKTQLADARTQALKELQDQLDSARQENTNLRDQLALKDKEVTSLNNQAKLLTERLNPTAASQLEEVKENILLALAAHEELSDDAIASLVQTGKQVVAFHLEELRKKNFVHASHFAGSDWSGAPPRTEWSIQHAGREYLVRRDMLA
jgi:predicted nuclease with TOPRIM domain